jgi:hypothetical protein
MTVKTTSAEAGRAAVRPGNGTRALLLFAAIAGPFFYLSSLLQALSREGFNIRVHPLSQLATGDAGWVQMLTFVVAGAGGIALAAGYRRVRTEGVGRRAVPLFVALFGLAFVIAGLFPMDPQNGFPAGAPAGTVPLSWHAIVHTSAAAASFLALAVACIVLVVREIRARRVLPAIGHGVVALVLLLPVSPTESSVQIALTGAVAFAWVTVMAFRLRARA